MPASHPDDGRVAARHLVVIVASSGGLGALRTVCAGLPAAFPAAVAVVQHRMVEHASLFAALLDRASALEISDAREGQLLLAGTVVVAPPDRHMTVSPSRTVVLRAGPRIHHVLSSGDPLFISAAEAYGPELTAVVLTGGDGDGSRGVAPVKQHGGTVLVQDPATAFCGDMPRSSIATGMVDQVLQLDDIAPALQQIVARSQLRDGVGQERPRVHS